MRFPMRYLLLIIMSALLSIPAHSFQSYEMVGEGRMRWFVFNLYQARLLSPDGGYQKNRWPLALEITYQRKIKKRDLIETTMSEWQRMQTAYVPYWIEALNRFWPDVKKGDVLLLHVDIGGCSYFYYNGKLVGYLDDKNFTQAFLKIWLSDKARDLSLRNQLIGFSH